MDLMDYVPKRDEFVVTLKNTETGEALLNKDGSEMTMTFYAPHTQEYKGVKYDFADRALKAGKEEQPSYLDLENRIVELLYRTIKSWNITYGGVKPKLTPKKAKEVFEKVEFIRVQVNAALEKEGDFT